MSLRKPSKRITRILAENLRFLRSKKKLSQEALAELCGIRDCVVIIFFDGAEKNGL
jgi:transcriptional regulator with XRE-family HTH domain